MTQAGRGAISAIMERLHTRLAAVAQRPRNVSSVATEPRVLVGEAPRPVEPTDEPGKATRSPAKGVCAEEHDWTLRDGSWHCRICGTSAGWNGPIPDPPPATETIEPAESGEPAVVCPVCDEQTAGPLKRFRGFELCVPCYRTLTGKKYRGQQRASGLVVGDTTSSPAITGDKSSSRLEPRANREREYPVDQVRDLGRTFETICHKVWDRRTGRNSWGTDGLLLIDLVFRAAEDVVRLVDANVLDGSEIRMLDWIRLVASQPGDARGRLQEQERANGLPELPSELATACMHVTHRVRANDGSKDKKCLRLLDRSLEHFVGRACTHLRREGLVVG